MKKCTWCGKEYPDTTESCALDGHPLPGGEPVRTATEKNAHSLTPPGANASVETTTDWSPQWVDLGQVEDAFIFREGFSRPNWKAIKQALQQNASPEFAHEAWTEAAIQWVQQLRSELGGNYHVKCSQDFIMLSALEPSKAVEFLQFSEGTLQRIYQALGDAAWKNGRGRHVVLVFHEADDYYQYVSDFHKDGVSPTSGGCLIHKDYVHIAINSHEGKRIRRTMAHELLHNCVAHLSLPLWLNEGLAVTFERSAMGNYRPLLDHELQQRHLAFWNENNIQRFWAGVSFHEPGDSNELSYSLGEIMVNLLLRRPKEFVEFVKLARWEDAGQTASLDGLGSDLGDTMGTFLGEGKWRPNRKAMVGIWDAEKAKKVEKQSGRMKEADEPSFRR